MADVTTQSATTGAPDGGGLSTETIIIIVGSIAGGLLLLVVILVCVVGYFLCRGRERNDNETGRSKKKPKSKEEEVHYTDRIFRPIDWGNPAGPEERNDMTEIDLVLFEESRSRRGSIAMKNPAFRDDDGENIGETKLSNGHAHKNGDGPPRLPNLDMLPPICRQQSNKSQDSSKPYSSEPRTPTSPSQKSQISILDQRTWGTPDITADIQPGIDKRNEYHDDDPRSTSQMNTVSGSMTYPEVDFSVFGNMRGAAMQENTLRRSFKSRSQAIVDFYESGYSNSIGARSNASLPLSRMDHQVESDDRPVTGYGTGSKMLWQKRQFKT